MSNYDIIYAPVITEKSSGLQTMGKYVFKVNERANKHQIKQAVEQLFNVKVKKVRTMNTHPHVRRKNRKEEGLTKRYKKAIIELRDGFTISFD